jgi:hypothetical protein
MRIVLPLAWFITMVGGWTDIRKVAAGELLGFGQSARPDHEPVLLGEPLGPEETFGAPTRIAVAGSELLLVDRYRAESVVAMDRRSGAIIRSFGTAGEGPGEFKSPMSLIVDGDDVAVLDAGLNRITWLGRDTSDSGFHLEKLASILANSVAIDFARTPGSGFLITGFMDEHRLARITSAGRVVGVVGRPLSLGSLPSTLVGEVMQGSLRGGPDHAHFVLTSRFASHMEIIDAETLTMTTVWGPEHFGPHPGPRYETRFGYLDSAPMPDGFLALYSGRTRDAFPGRANYGSTIHEFSWDGRLRAVYELDSDVISIAWSEEDLLLYAVRHDPEPGVVVYSLQ